MTAHIRLEVHQCHPITLLYTNATPSHCYTPMPPHHTAIHQCHPITLLYTNATPSHCYTPMPPHHTAIHQCHPITLLYTNATPSHCYTPMPPHHTAIHQCHPITLLYTNATPSHCYTPMPPHHTAIHNFISINFVFFVTWNILQDAPSTIHQPHAYPFQRHLAKYISLLVKLCSTDEIFKFLSYLWACPCQIITSEVKDNWLLRSIDVNQIVIGFVTKMDHAKGRWKVKCMNVDCVSHSIQRACKIKELSIINCPDKAATPKGTYSKYCAAYIEYSWNSITLAVSASTIVAKERHKKYPYQPSPRNVGAMCTHENILNIKCITLGHENGENEGDRVSCQTWSSTPMPCSAAPTISALLGCCPLATTQANVTFRDAIVRGYKKGLQRQSSQKKDSECACEAEDSSPSSTEMVHTTLNVVREFKDDMADLVTGREGHANPRCQFIQNNDTQLLTSHYLSDIQNMTQTDFKGIGSTTIGPIPATINNPAMQNIPTTIASMALITTPLAHPRIQIPSSTEALYLCKESRAIFNSATECLCSEDYSHMIPLLEQITQHTCATQHCQALLFRHFGLGLAHYKMGDHHEATKHFMEYRSLALTLARPADISLAHVYLGDISTIKSNYSNAAYHYLEAIHNYGANNPSTLFKLVMPSVSALYAKQGAALKQTSQMLQAVEAFRNAIHHAPDINSMLPVHNSLGNLLQSMGDYTGALQEYKEAVKLGEELNDLIFLSWAHGNLGNAYLGLHQKDAALHHLKKALALTIEHESTPQAISRAYNNLGTAYQSLEDFKGAEENFNLALDQAIYGNDVAGQARARGNLGNLLMLSKEYERAVEQYSEVFRLSKDRQVLSTAYHNRGCAYLEWAEQLRSEKKGTTSTYKSCAIQAP